MSRLVATSIAVENLPPLHDIAGSHGMLFVHGDDGIATVGEFTRVNSANANDFLRNIEHRFTDAHDEGGPVALGFLFFLREETEDLFVPHIFARHFSDGYASITVCTDALLSEEDRRKHVDLTVSSVMASLRVTQSPKDGGRQLRSAPLTPIATYLSAVGEARDAVRSGHIEKAVIARDIELTSDTPLRIHSVVQYLHEQYSTCYQFSIDNMVGASPELLVQLDNGTVHSNPLAGTTPRTGDKDTDAMNAAALLASRKNQIEHRVVVEMVHDTLLQWCSYLDWEPEPSVVSVANVQHLGTHVTGPLSALNTHVLDIARELCPTPALGGFPRTAAIDLINKVEHMHRGRYGGAVGWCDAQGNGTWAVTIRCAQFSEDLLSARLFAGGGIVADSEPDLELAETEAKFKAMTNAIMNS
ncbi:MAG: isochorismate synthase [Ilumatobacteraceae bacterium]|nr:isochorismate synthase [Ilumatobacteraceae bacterium]